MLALSEENEGDYIGNLNFIVSLENSRLQNFIIFILLY